MDPSEKLTIETPEQITLEFPLAGLGSRALAMMVDTLIQIITVVVVIIVLRFIMPDLSQHWVGAGNWTVAVAIFAMFCLYWGYFAIFESLWNGQTPGKRYAKIRVISDSGRPITAFEAMARNFMRAIDSQIGYFVGCVAIAIDKRNRRLGDMVAGTVVIHEIERQGDTDWYTDRRASVPAAGDAITKLTIAEFQLIEAFLARRLDLPAEKRQQAAKDIADRVGARLNVAPAERPSNEDFLEEIARRFRDSAPFR